MSRRVNPVVHGKMYKVSDGGSIKGVKFNKNGTVQVLVVPKTKRNPRKKKRNKAKAKRNCRKRNAPKRREYTLYPGGITFPTAADARSALEGAVASGSLSAYVLTPTGKRLKVSERRRKQLTRKQNHRSARARNKPKRPTTSRKAPNYKKKKNRRSR